MVQLKRHKDTKNMLEDQQYAHSYHIICYCNLLIEYINISTISVIVK